MVLALALTLPKPTGSIDIIPQVYVFSSSYATYACLMYILLFEVCDAIRSIYVTCPGGVQVVSEDERSGRHTVNLYDMRNKLVAYHILLPQGQQVKRISCQVLLLLLCGMPYVRINRIER